MSSIEHLRDIFSQFSDTDTFVEPQTIRYGGVRSDADIDAELRSLAAEMRERYGFRTSLTTDELVAVARGHASGDDDATVAKSLGVSTDVVTRARLHLHLVRPEDAAGVDLHVLGHLVDEGATDAAVADRLDVGVSTVGRATRALAAVRQSNRVGHRYQAAFESVFSAAGFPTPPTTLVRNDRLIESDEFGSDVA